MCHDPKKANILHWNNLLTYFLHTASVAVLLFADSFFLTGSGEVTIKRENVLIANLFVWGAFAVEILIVLSVRHLIRSTTETQKKLRFDLEQELARGVMAGHVAFFVMANVCDSTGMCHRGIFMQILFFAIWFIAWTVQDSEDDSAILTENDSSTNKDGYALLGV